MSLLSPLIAAVGPALAATAAAAHKVAPGPAATLNPALLKQLQDFQFANGPKTKIAATLPWLTHTFAGFFIAFAAALIVLLAMQTTKQEGLSGTIGGRVESAYRPRLGFDQQLARFTSFVAIGMVFFAVVLSITGI